MRINWQFQNRHLEQPDNKWVVFQQIERDICYCYYQLSSYSYIMGDLYYSEIYNLPYWKFINITIDEVQSEERLSFIREGCLILILAMAWEAIDGAGTYIIDKLDNIINNLSVFEPLNESESNLYEIVFSSVKYVKTNEGDLNLLTEQSIWVHKEYIRDYFEKKAKEFKNSPYFKYEPFSKKQTE